MSDLEYKLKSSADMLGYEMSEAKMQKWIEAVSDTGDNAHGLVQDEETGIFGHKVSMLDFDPAQLARFREIGRIIEFDDVPGKIETALALSGSAAQSKVQTHPGDADFFERVNIIAETRDEAVTILAEIMRAKALETFEGPSYQFIEMKFGSYPQDVIRNGETCKAGSPISWSGADVQAGQITGETPDGSPVTLTLEDVKGDPGWCKLDWVIADPVNKQLANASNMLDVTWEAPDGSIAALDGYLDGYFQEIYLDGDSQPLVAKVVSDMSSDKVDDYLSQLEGEARKYCQPGKENYGKAAKRLYNVFRLNGRYGEAAYLRDMFDEPAALLYQVHAVMKTVEEAYTLSTAFAPDDILDQLDELIVAIVDTLEGAKEVTIVRSLLQVYRGIAKVEPGEKLGGAVDAARAEVLNIVNNFFYEKLTAHPEIRAFVKGS
jgi:hypothetical protein